tara:strand:+ start:225 stop:1271 length:1047 start_codon:yes stop_codon:yes gene_type:complete
MTIALITDQHLDGRKNSQAFWEFFMKFYDNVFFPTLKKHKIKTIIDLGDTFDNRKSMDLNSWHRMKTRYFQVLADMGIEIHMLVGNHTAYYKNTNKVNTPDLLLDSFDNIHTYDEVTDVEIEGRKFTMLPWINPENEDHVRKHLDNTDSEVVCGHLELNGFAAIPGHYFEGGGWDRRSFTKFKKVYSGHFHFPSEKGNVKYLGNPYEMFWNDCGSRRGFHLFEPSTLALKFIQNPYTIFKKIFYDEDTWNKNNFNPAEYKDCFVKLIVVNKNNSIWLDRIIEKLYDSGIHDLKIIDDTVMDQEEVGGVEHEDTLTILNKYIEQMDNKLDKPELKSIMKSIYLEACEVQ